MEPSVAIVDSKEMFRLKIDQPGSVWSWLACEATNLMSHRGITITVMRYEVDDDGTLYYVYMVHLYTTV